MPVEPDRIAHTLRVRLHDSSVRVTAADRRLHVIRHHYISGRPDIEIQLAVRTEGKVFPEMAWLLRGIEPIDDDFPLGRIVQPRLYAAVTRDAAAPRNVQRAFAERDAIRRLEPFEDL